MGSTANIEVMTKDRCTCGREKLRKMPFCKGCYFMLPKRHQRVLWAAAQAFHEAYNEARGVISNKFHEKHGR